MKKLLIILNTVTLFCLSASIAFSAPVVKSTAMLEKVVVAPNQETTIQVIINLKAGQIVQKEKREPVAVTLVIDYSQSMSDAKKMDYALTAAKALTSFLNKDDKLGIIIYSSEAKVLYPLSFVKDKAAINKLIDGISPYSMTFISGGLEKAGSLYTDSITGNKRIILLSDGLANRGITSTDGLGKLAGSIRESAAPISSIGLGLDYSEDTMQKIAQRGGGRYYYVKDAEELPEIFNEELKLITDTITKDFTFTITVKPGVTVSKVYGHTFSSKSDKTSVDVSDFYANEDRQILLELTVKADKEGKVDLGAIALDFIDSNTNKANQVTVPLTVTVTKDARVQKELQEQNKTVETKVTETAQLYIAEEMHVAAVEALQKGDRAQAEAIMTETRTNLSAIVNPSAAVINKMQAMEKDQSYFAEAAQSADMQADLVKTSKVNALAMQQGKANALYLAEGSTGLEVRRLQKALKEKGFYKGEETGTFDAAVKEAVIAFQKSVKLDADGIAGITTLDKLGLGK